MTMKTASALQVPWFGKGQRFLIAIGDQVGPRTAPQHRTSKTARRQYKTAEKAIRAGNYLLAMGGGW